MPTRIIHCTLGFLGVFGILEHEELRTLEQGMVVAIEDDALEEVLSAGSEAAILFLSRDAYNAATVGLSEVEVDRALRDRLKRWSPNILEEAFAIVAARQKRALTLTAHAHAQLSREFGSDLLEHFSNGLDLLASFLGEGRFDDVATNELLEIVIEKEALLLAELNGSEEGRMHATLARTLADELKRLGDPDFAEALPNKTPLRGIWAAPADEGLKAALRWRGVPIVDFRDGVVTVIAERLLGKPPFETRRTRVLYSDPGQFYQDLSELSAPALNRRLEARFNADASSGEKDRTNYLNALRLDQALMRRVVYKRAVTEKWPLGPELGRQLNLEAAALMNRLVGSDTWIGREVNTSTLRPLLEAEDDILSDSRLLLSLSKRNGNGYLVRRLSGVLAMKQAHRERLERLR